MNIPMTAASGLKWVAYGPCTVQRIHGINSQGADLYIQLHQVVPNSDGTLTAGTVPIVKSLTVIAGLPFEFNNLNLETSGLVVAVSSTEANYTAVAGGAALDMVATVASDSLCDGTEVVVGDLTTGVNHLSVWNEGVGPKRLLLTQVVNNTGAALFLLLFATDPPNVGSTPTISYPIPDGGTTKLSFGIEGMRSMTKSADTQIIHQGCDLYASTAASIAVTIAPSTVSIKAVYK